MRVTGENIRWNITNRSEGSDSYYAETHDTSYFRGDWFRSEGSDSSPRRGALRYTRRNTSCYVGDWFRDGDNASCYTRDWFRAPLESLFSGRKKARPVKVRLLD